MLKLYREYKELKAAGARVKPVWRILVGLAIYPFYRAAECFVRYRKVVIEDCAKAIEALVISNPLDRDSQTHNAALGDALAALGKLGFEIREKSDD